MVVPMVGGFNGFMGVGLIGLGWAWVLWVLLCRFMVVGVGSGSPPLLISLGFGLRFSGWV